jgi:hypothetical protein
MSVVIAGLVRASDLLLMDLKGIAVLHIELFEIRQLWRV